MRLTVGIFLGICLLALASCGTSQRQAAPVANGTQTSSESESRNQQDVHVVGGGHAEHGRGDTHSAAHELATHHGSRGGHGVTEADHHGNPSTSTAPHPRHGSHHRGDGGRAHSREHAGDEVKGVAVGDKVPDFEVTIAGKKWKFSELQKNAAMTEDGTFVLTFWCSFCHSCRHVEHSLDALAKQYQGKAGVIALDASAGETTEGVAEFAKQRDLTLPIALDASGAAADILGTRVTTTTVVIDKLGVLRYRGRFGDEQHAFAHDALRAVLAGEDVPVQETRQKG